MKKKIYLIGGKLSHSFSPEIHNGFGGYDYELLEMNENDVETFVRSYDYDGLNITVPYKKLVATFMDELSETAARTGAVNTVIRKNGKLYGDNTDYEGFAFLLKYHRIDVKDKSVYLLGKGGASATVRAVLIDLGAAEIKDFSHTEISRGIKGRCDILINCTPVGTYPETQVAAVSLDALSVDYAVIDLIYNPFRTRLLLQAEEKGLVAVNGLSMLVSQAAHSAKYFGGKLPDDNTVAAIIKRVEHLRTNVVLTGFGGSGKSTIANELHKLTGRTVVDTDSEIESLTGRTVTDIILSDGEKEFRKIENSVIRGLVGRMGLIIATGGGAVLDNSNAELLRQCGEIVFLKRAPVEKDFVGRPLYNTFSDAEIRYAERLSAYEATADIIFNNDHTKSAREAALEIYNEIIGN